MRSANLAGRVFKSVALTCLAHLLPWHIPRIASFVLVHGGWGGGWEWHAVARELRAQGHDAWTPTLTGTGERAHLGGPGIGVETHMADLIGVLEHEDLEQVVLCGQQRWRYSRHWCRRSAARESQTARLTSTRSSPATGNRRSTSFPPASPSSRARRPRRTATGGASRCRRLLAPHQSPFALWLLASRTLGTLVGCGPRPKLKCRAS